MKKTLKNIDIIQVRNSLKELTNENLPVITGWNISKNLRMLDNSLKVYVDCEKNLVNKYAIKDDDGNVVLDENNQPKFAPKNKELFIKEQQELLNCEDEFDFYNIKLSDIQNINIKPSVLFNLDFMIIDDVE